MARKAVVPFLAFLLVFSASECSTDGRKLLTDVWDPSLDGGQYLTALPKGKVPSSTPGKNAHVITAFDEQLIAAHLAAVDRILRSVPSPGVGH